MTLTEFLLARLAEDEATVSEDPKWDNPPNDMRIQWSEVGGMSEVLVIGEARLRIECQVKRRLIEDLDGYCWNHHGGTEPCGECGRIGCRNLRVMALPYAGHPDYQQEWRP